jgi:hypothetical protein
MLDALGITGVGDPRVFSIRGNPQEAAAVQVKELQDLLQGAVDFLIDLLRRDVDEPG